MVVEDDHEIRVSIRLCLERAGFFVVSAANGAIALHLLKEISKPSAILLDVNMPIMGGEEFLEVIKPNLNLNKIPVVQLSADNEEWLNGVKAALAKPFSPEELVAAINNCLE